MKKILFITNLRLPTEKANGYQIVTMCKEYVSLGYDVELIIPRRRNFITKNIFEYYGLEETFSVKKIGWINVIPLAKYIGSVAYWLNAVFFLLTIVFLGIEKGSVVYTRSPEIAWLAKIKRLRSVYECHDWFGKSRWLSLFFLRKIDLIVATNNSIRNRFLEYGFDRSKTIVASNAVDVALFNISITKYDARKKLSLSQDENIIVYTGHLYERKGVYILAEAAKKLPSSTSVYFVGGTNKDVELFKKKYKNISSIKVVGHRPHTEIPLWQRASDVLVFPNTAKELVSSLYTSPLKLFEYMASGRPIIASNLPAVLEIINDDVAFIINSGNSQELRETIVKVLKNKDSSSSKASKAYDLVKEKTWKNRAQMIHAKIKELDNK